MTKLTSYGTLAPHRQKELIRGIAPNQPNPPIDPDTLAQVMAALQKMGGKALG